jgi:hypothetical protein
MPTIPANWFTRPNPAMDARTGAVECSQEWLDRYQAKRTAAANPHPPVIALPIASTDPARARRESQLATAPRRKRGSEKITSSPAAEPEAATPAAVCHPETNKPDPSTAAARLAEVVEARKARTAKPRKPRNEWHQVPSGRITA